MLCFVIEKNGNLFFSIFFYYKLIKKICLFTHLTCTVFPLFEKWTRYLFSWANILNFSISKDFFFITILQLSEYTYHCFGWHLYANGLLKDQNNFILLTWKNLK